MKTRIKQAQQLMTEANALLNQSMAMLERSQQLQDFNAQYSLFGRFKEYAELYKDIEEAEKNAKFLFESYLVVIKKIQEL